MDSMLEKTVLTISHTLGIGMVETYLLIGAVLLFTVYKIIDLAGHARHTHADPAAPVMAVLSPR